MVFFCGCGGGLVVGGCAFVVGGDNVCGYWGVLALMMDFRKFMLPSPPELAHCASPPPRQERYEKIHLLTNPLSDFLEDQLKSDIIG